MNQVVQKVTRHFYLCLRFYGSSCIFSSLISVAIIHQSLGEGVSAIVLSFWFKLFTLLITLIFVWYQNSRRFYYYKNLGLSKKALLVSCFFLDFSLYGLMYSGAFFVLNG